jgi:hypothetical protein
MVKNKYRITYSGKVHYEENCEDKYSAVTEAAHRWRIPWTKVAREGDIIKIESPRDQECNT